MIDEPEDKDGASPEATPPAGARPGAPRPLSASKDSDHAVRPGFRSPANTRSKAQKKGKKKR